MKDTKAAKATKGLKAKKAADTATAAESEKTVLKACKWHKNWDLIIASKIIC